MRTFVLAALAAGAITTPGLGQTGRQQAATTPVEQGLIGSWCGGYDIGGKLSVELQVTSATPDSFTGIHHWKGKGAYSKPVTGAVGHGMLSYSTSSAVTYEYTIGSSRLDGKGKNRQSNKDWFITLKKSEC